MGIQEETASTDPLQAYADGLLGFGHPIRIRALVLLESEHSPRALADAMDAPLGVVSYHVRMLRTYGLVEQTREQPRRGALQHFYRRTDLAEDLMAKLAAFFDVPTTRAGRRGTDARVADLNRWANMPWLKARVRARSGRRAEAA